MHAFWFFRFKKTPPSLYTGMPADGPPPQASKRNQGKRGICSRDQEINRQVVKLPEYNLAAMMCFGSDSTAGKLQAPNARAALQIVLKRRPDVLRTA
jgi:hypothetical protein